MIVLFDSIWDYSGVHRQFRQHLDKERDLCNMCNSATCVLHKGYVVIYYASSDSIIILARWNPGQREIRHVLKQNTTLSLY